MRTVNSASLDTLSAKMVTNSLVTGPILVVENGLRVCKGSQKVVQAKEIINFHNILQYIERRVVSKQAEKVSKQAEFAVVRNLAKKWLQKKTY